MKLIEWINIKTGRRFHYSIKLTYLESGNPIFYFHATVGLTEKRIILEPRDVKRIFQDRIHESIKKPETPRNGTVDILTVCYLGWMKKQIKWNQSASKNTKTF